MTVATPVRELETTDRDADLDVLEALLEASDEVSAEFDFVTMSIADREVNMILRC